MKYPSPGDNHVHPDPEIFRHARTLIAAEIDRNANERTEALTKLANEEAARAGGSTPYLYTQSGPYWQRRMDVQLDFTEQLLRGVAKIWIDTTRKKNKKLTPEDESYISHELSQMAEQTPKHIGATISIQLPGVVQSLMKRAEDRCAQVLSQLRVELKQAVYEDKYPPLNQNSAIEKENKSEWTKPAVWGVGIIVGIIVGISIEIVKALWSHTRLEWGEIFNPHLALWTLLTFGLVVVLVMMYRRFRIITDLRVVAEPEFVSGYGWMWKVNIRSSHSAPRYVLADIKVMKHNAGFGYEGDELSGFDRSAVGKLIQPGTMDDFRAGVVTEAKQDVVPTLSELQAGLGWAWAAMRERVFSMRLIVRTEGGLEYKAFGAGRIHPRWMRRLFKVRRWLDENWFKPTK